MKISKDSTFTDQTLTLLPTQTLISPPDSPLPDKRSSHLRKSKNPSFPGTGIRVKRNGRGGGRGPATPLLKWKVEEEEDGVSVSSGDGAEKWRMKGRRKGRRGGGGGEVVVSARQLAAGLWQLQLPEFDGNEGRDLKKKTSVDDWLEVEHGEVLVDVPILCHQSSGEYGTEVKDLLQTSLAISAPNNQIVHKVEPSVPLLKSAREHATKWDPGLKTSDEVYKFYSHMKLLEDQQVASTSVVSDLQAELEQACSRINELEAERQSSKEKLEHYIRKVADEKASWQRRELNKMRAVIDDVKDEMKRERKNCQRMEIVNAKLVNELAEIKLSARQFMQNYDRERKERELMEEVCDELAKELGEEKAEIETLKSEAAKLGEEVEDERRMLQMAEVWREERVQMKLIDARLTLEERYSQLNKLIVDIEAFLKLRGVTADMMETREIELLKEASNLIDIADMKEFSYKPPDPSEDIFAVFEDLQSGGPIDREIEPCLEDSHSGQESKIQTTNSEDKCFIKNSEQRYSNGFIDQKRDGEEYGSGLETSTDTEEHGSSFSPEGSDFSVNKTKRDSSVSVGLPHWDEIPETEIISVSVRRLKKSSSISRLWRSNPSNGGNKMTVEGTNGRLSNGCTSPDIVEEWSSPDARNSHLARGKCIDWTRGVLKNTLKAKLLEARMESKKMQLRHVLKQNT